MGHDNYSTIPVQQSLEQIAQSRALEAIQTSGLSLPCKVTAVDGSMVTVSFELVSQWTLPPVTIPKEESQWGRMPTQVGDFGIVRAADASLGPISGQGGAVANFPQNQGNLSNLVWVPCASLAFPEVPANVGPNRAFFNGPDGAYVGDAAATVYTLHDGVGGTVSIPAPATTGRVVLGGLASVSGNVAATRAVFANADATSLSNSIVAKTLQNFSVALAAAASSTLTGGPAFAAIIGAAGYVTGIANIHPDIPDGSSIVRVVS